MGKRWILLLPLLLLGCSAPKQDATEQALAFRAKLLEAAGCSFQCTVTADYADSTTSFCLDCRTDADGVLSFTVLAPESIRGITGSAEPAGGALTFDSVALTFPLLAEGRLSPAAGPVTMFTAWRTGYLSSCGDEQGALRLTVQTDFEEDPLTVDTWLDAQGNPFHGEISFRGRKVLTLAVEDFQLLE